MDSELECICFGRGERKLFAVSGDHRPGPLPGQPGKIIQLRNPLRGKWPTSDAGDSTLELYARVEFYVCREGPCTDGANAKNKQAQPCGTLGTGLVRERTPIFTNSTKQSPKKTDIIGSSGLALEDLVKLILKLAPLIDPKLLVGLGVKELIELILKLGGLGGRGGVLGANLLGSRDISLDSTQFAVTLSRAELDRDLDVVRRRVAALEQLSGREEA